MQLYYQRYPADKTDIALEVSPRPPLLIIPGLFGSTTNWRSVAKRIGEDYPVWVIDQRNHGRSPHASSHSYTDMCNDLLEFLDQHGLSQVILCGHSMGGKVAMLFSLRYPERVAKLAVLDIAPVVYTHSHAPFLKALMRIDLASLKSRSEADRALQTAIPDTATRLFLLQSLSGSPGEYHWCINLSVLHDYMSEIACFPIDLVARSKFLKETVFMYGEQSDYVQLAYHPDIVNLFTNVKFVGIANAGHWLHAEQPDAVVAQLQDFMNNFSIHEKKNG